MNNKDFNDIDLTHAIYEKRDYNRNYSRFCYQEDVYQEILALKKVRGF